jgi:hypothetical protein
LADVGSTGIGRSVVKKVLCFQWAQRGPDGDFPTFLRPIRGISSTWRRKSLETRFSNSRLTRQRRSILRRESAACLPTLTLAQNSDFQKQLSRRRQDWRGRGFVLVNDLSAHIASPQKGPGLHRRGEAHRLIAAANQIASPECPQFAIGKLQPVGALIDIPQFDWPEKNLIKHIKHGNIKIPCQ